MAMFDATKKKPEDAVDPVAGLPGGVLAGMTKLQETAANPPPKPQSTLTLKGGINPATVGTRPAPGGLPTASEAGQGAGLLARAGAVMAQIPTLARRLMVGKTGNAVADGMSSFGAGVQSGYTGQPVAAAPPTAAPTLNRSTPARPAVQPAAPAAAAPAAPVGIHIIDPLNPSTMGALPASAVAAAAPGATAPVGTTAQTPVVAAAQPTLHPGDVNTFTGANGVTRAVPGMTTAPGGVGAVGGGPVAVASNPVVPASVDAPVAATPNVTLARSLTGDLSGAERERQALLSDISSQAFRAGMGPASRGQRQMLEHLGDQRLTLTRDRMAQQTGLETSGAQMANSAAEEQARLAGSTNEGNADRKQRASDTASAATLRRGELDAQNTQVKDTITNEDGTTSLLRNDGSVTPITDAAGKPFRELNKSGSITDSDRFTAYSKEAAAINENTLLKPEERDAALARLQQRPEYAGVISKAGGATPDAAHIAFLKANPSKAADFDAKFGKGASSRYLSH